MNLLDVWSILVRRRWVVALAVATCTVTAIVGSFVATPLYMATSTLQIERQNPDILTFRDLAQTDYSWGAYYDFYETQYQVLASDAVAVHAVDRLDLLQHPAYAEATERGPGLIARLRSLLPSRSAPEVEVDPEQQAAEWIRGSLQVEPVRNSHLVKVSWVSDDPELAADVANAVAAAYIQYTLQSQFSASGQAEEFLINQIAALKLEIGAIESDLQTYGEAKGIVSIDDTSNITLKALQDVSSRRTSAQAELAAARTAWEAVRDAPADALPEVRESGLIGRLREEYASYEAEYAERSRKYGDDWPGMQTLRSKLDGARERLQVETDRIATQVRAAARADYDEARSRVEALESLLRDQEASAQALKRNAIEFANLRSEVEKKRETLDALIERQNQMSLSTRLKDMDASSSNIRIVDRAKTPTAPFKPRTKVNVLLGLFFGMVLGVGAALLLDYLDNTIGSPADLERVIDLPLLAVIPRSAAATTGSSLTGMRKAPVPADSPADLLSHADPRTPAAEAYRELRTSILLSSAGHPPARIVVTSALPEEGKTATAINLAIVLAQLGRRVVIVDTDLRRPRVHKAFRVDNQRGVSTYLSGMADDPVSLVRHTDVPDLDLLSSGPVPPNPSELLNSATFEEMGRRLLDAGYDHVIFDSPPTLSVSDPVIVASVVDAGILVVRAALTPRQSVRLAAEKLGKNNVAPVGVVLNDLDGSSRGASYYAYHSYGHYEDRDRKRKGA